MNATIMYRSENTILPSKPDHYSYSGVIPSIQFNRTNYTWVKVKYNNMGDTQVLRVIK